MSVLEEILYNKKIMGMSWEKLAEKLPISGDSLRIAFNRKSVNDVYLKILCDDLDIKTDKKEQSEQNRTNKEVSDVPSIDLFKNLKIDDKLNTLYDLLLKNKLSQDRAAEALDQKIEIISNAVGNLLLDTEEVYDEIHKTRKTKKEN